MLTNIFTEPAHLAPLIGAAIGVFGVFGAVFYANKLETDKERRRSKNIILEDLLYVLNFLTSTIKIHGQRLRKGGSSDADNEEKLLQIVCYYCAESCERLFKEIRLNSHYLSEKGLKHYRLARVGWKMMASYEKNLTAMEDRDEEITLLENFALKQLCEIRRDFAGVAEDLGGHPLRPDDYEIFENLSDPKFEEACQRHAAAAEEI